MRSTFEVFSRRHSFMYAARHSAQRDWRFAHGRSLHFGQTAFVEPLVVGVRDAFRFCMRSICSLT